jgi:hypothetical protein
MSFAILDSGALNSTLCDQGLVVWAVFMAILADKDKDGITTLRPKQIAKNFHHPVKEIEDAWDVLAKPDPESKNDAHEGRRIIPTDDGRWIVVSHDKYRSIHKQAVRQEQIRSAKQRQRAREAKGADTHGGPTPEETAKAFEKDPEVEALLERGPAPVQPKGDKWL